MAPSRGGGRAYEPSRETAQGHNFDQSADAHLLLPQAAEQAHTAHAKGHHERGVSAEHAHVPDHATPATSVRISDIGVDLAVGDITDENSEMFQLAESIAERGPDTLSGAHLVDALARAVAVMNEQGELHVRPSFLVGDAGVPFAESE